MTEFNVDELLKPLAGFQRATVEHVFKRLYGDDPVRRFLVADETGLGKSMVARGVVTKTIEHLLISDDVKRIDVVYVCSNADIARQNVKRLDVTGNRHSVATRLTLLARDGRRLDRGTKVNGKPVNLISFTPGTLPGNAWATGTAEERALIHVILAEKLGLTRSEETASLRLLQGTVQTVETMWRRATEARDEAKRHGGLEPRITNEFFKSVSESGLLAEYRGYVDRIRPTGKVSHEIKAASWQLIARFRTELAKASVAALEPDLLILDEFQRFRDLINPDPDNPSEAARLAQDLFNFGDARVLLLSATPVKAFTYAEESDTDDHGRDLGRILEFLAEGSSVDPAQVTKSLAEFRRRAIAGADVSSARESVRSGLLKLMCRTERPRVGETGMLDEAYSPISVEPEDLTGWVGLRHLADVIGAPMTLEYWKSAPYFANFLDGYKFGDELKKQLKTQHGRERVQRALAGVHTLDATSIAQRQPLSDLGSARLRRLDDMTLGKGMHELLWVPPSLPYLPPGGPYATATAATATKQLIFSSWSATPTAVASLLSYQADRRLSVPETDLTRLAYRVEGDRAGAMTTLMLFWPTPGLAELTDPLQLARELSVDASVDDALALASARLTDRLPPAPVSRTASAEAGYWQAAIAQFGSAPVDDVDTVVDALTGGTDEDPDDSPDDAHDRRGGQRLLRAHVQLALDTLADPAVPEAREDLATVAAQIGMHAPGNVAWRALNRLVSGSAGVTEAGLWRAAAALASGFRSLFNRPEAIGVLDLHTKGEPYWQAVLTYCGWGNLQALLDEHLHHLVLAEGNMGELDDEALMSLARAVRATLTLRPSPYAAFDPHDPDNRIRFASSRFALRYGSARHAEGEARLPEIRNAFNSPFWPWVLATTSVGQEGIDFHWWCHSIVHWNTPANPVDFEQREGRVNRYGGLAVRRNLALRHRAGILAGDEAPWRTAYKLGEDERENLKTELVPHWVYPGPVQIQRTVLPYPLSLDGGRYQRITDDLALYRLTFGQPRQEDLLSVLRRNGVQEDPARIAQLTLDLRPPVTATSELTARHR
ncbi:MAG: helicase C-terminal domain-containing protein [Acidimicrobiia bacterium]